MGFAPASGRVCPPGSQGAAEGARPRAGPPTPELPFVTFLGLDCPQQLSSILLQTASKLRCVIFVASIGNMSADPGLGGSPSPQRPRRLGGWKSFTLPVTVVLVWLSVGKSGTTEPPGGNHRDTDRSLKAQNIWSVTFSIWANRALFTSHVRKPAEAKAAAQAPTASRETRAHHGQHQG